MKWFHLILIRIHKQRFGVQNESKLEIATSNCRWPHFVSNTIFVFPSDVDFVICLSISTAIYPLAIRSKKMPTVSKGKIRCFDFVSSFIPQFSQCFLIFSLLLSSSILSSLCTLMMSSFAISFDDNEFFFMVEPVKRESRQKRNFFAINQRPEHFSTGLQSESITKNRQYRWTFPTSSPLLL